MSEKMKNSIDGLDLPSNSHKSKEDKKINPVVKDFKIKKKNPGKKFSENFLGDDLNNVAKYVGSDVILPAAKDLISKIISNGIDRLLYGDAKPVSRSKKDAYRSYDSYYGYTPDKKEQRTPRERIHYADDIIVNSREDAENIIDSLRENIERFGLTTIADLYALVGRSSTAIDNKYGWTKNNIQDITYKRYKDGFEIVVPKPRLVD